MLGSIPSGNVSQSGIATNPTLEKQLKEVNKQKELLAKL
jgi:hypothetical protein